MTGRGHAAVPGAAILGAAYATNFAALAASAPFLAIYLASCGFAPDVTAQVLALCSIVRVVAVPAWTMVADRARASGTTLGATTAGAVIAVGALTVIAQPRDAVVVLLLVAFTVLRAPAGPLLDAMMLWRARASGQPFGAVRAWGTAGYAVGALAAGALVARWGVRAALWATVSLLATTLVATQRLGRGDASGGAHHGPDGNTARALVRLVLRPRMAVLFAVALLQQTGLAAYDNLFPAYLAKLAGATVAGAAVSLGAASEFLFLAFGARWLRRLGPERLLAAACIVSAVRWAGIAVLGAPAVLVALQVLHAVSFGAFYMSAVVIVDAESPRALRASAQGAFGAFCFGVGGAIALSSAGAIERAGGSVRSVFAVGAGASIAAAAASAWLAARSGRAGADPPQYTAGT